MTTENQSETANNSPVINTASNPVTKAETATPAMHEVNTLGSQFSDVRAAIQWVSHEANNPVKNRYSTEEHFAWSDLPELYRVIKPLMYQAGLFHSQTMKTNTDGVPEIVTTFHHIPTATECTFTMETTLKGIRKNQHLDECQQWGWTVTYCRRYALYAALGLQPDDGGDLDALTRRERNRLGAATAATRTASPATTSQREWLPMLGKEGETAERAAIKLGAIPFTAEEHARAAEQERRFLPLTPDEIDYIRRITAPLKGDLRELDGIQRALEAELFDKVRDGSVTFHDEEDQKRALYRVWLDACQEYDGIVTAKIITGTDAEADALIAKHYGTDESAPMPVYCPEDLASLDATAPEELARLAAKRKKHLEDVANGNKSTLTGDTAELDAIVAAVKSGETLQPPFNDPDKLPAVDLTNEHAVLMRQKVTLCRELADGEGTVDEKVIMINRVLSRADFQAAAEINEILARLTNTGAPASVITEADIPY
ncbi:ERF family protein [Buttiauxella brennerae]|uniref:ERF family protein n=1 Tax=Buttiauxella brennerae TaxID=82988 RepID=UPI00286F46D4|nr:ERF family protein [Buttiauxella brennerae]